MDLKEREERIRVWLLCLMVVVGLIWDEHFIYRRINN